MVVTVLESMFGAMKRSVGCVSKLAALLNESQLRGVVLSAVMFACTSPFFVEICYAKCVIGI